MFVKIGKHLINTDLIAAISPVKLSDKYNGGGAAIDIFTTALDGDVGLSFRFSSDDYAAAKRFYDYWESQCIDFNREPQSSNQPPADDDGAGEEG